MTQGKKTLNRMSFQTNLAEQRRSLPEGTVLALASVTAFVSVALIALYSAAPVFSTASVIITASVWIISAAIILFYARFHHHEKFGHANFITTLRAAVSAMLAGCIPVAAVLLNANSSVAWLIAITAAITLCLDGLDGYLARKTHLCSSFGARFDMETDAFLAFILTLILWQSEKVGLWVIGLGILRYAFILASLKYTALQGDLFPSMRRKVVCVIQVGALCLMLFPVISPKQATVFGVVALACLVWSFAVDIVWLCKHRGTKLRQDVLANEN